MTAMSLNLPRRRFRLTRRPPESILPAVPRPERRDSHGRLVSALLILAGEACLPAATSVHPWCSATFIGARHHVTLRLSGDDAHAQASTFARALPEAQFAIPGHIVADIVVEGVREDGAGGMLIDVEALTVEDW